MDLAFAQILQILDFQSRFNFVIPVNVLSFWWSFCWFWREIWIPSLERIFSYSGKAVNFWNATFSRDFTFVYILISVNLPEVGYIRITFSPRMELITMSDTWGVWKSTLRWKFWISIRDRRSLKNVLTDWVTLLMVKSRKNVKWIQGSHGCWAIHLY